MSAIPGWLAPLAAPVDLTAPLSPRTIVGPNPIPERRVPDGVIARPAAVLVLFCGGADESAAGAAGPLPEDAEVVLTERSSSLRQHSGQIAFPGGAVDPGDEGPVHTALREAQEETGLDPSLVRPLATLDPIFVPPSGFDVTPVLAWSAQPGTLRPMDRAETERVARVRLSGLLDPAHRYVVRHRLGYLSPAFEVDGMLVWGFTAGILAGLFDAFGWTREWDVTDVRDFDAAAAAVALARKTQVRETQARETQVRKTGTR